MPRKLQVHWDWLRRVKSLKVFICRKRREGSHLKAHLVDMEHCRFLYFPSSTMAAGFTPKGAQFYWHLDWSDWRALQCIWTLLEGSSYIDVQPCANWSLFSGQVSDAASNISVVALWQVNCIQIFVITSPLSCFHQRTPEFLIEGCCMQPEIGSNKEKRLLARIFREGTIFFSRVDKIQQ